MMQGAVAEGNSDLNEYKITVVPLVMLSSDHKGGKCSNMAVRKVGDIQYVSGTTTAIHGLIRLVIHCQDFPYSHDRPSVITLRTHDWSAEEQLYFYLLSQ